MLSDYISVRLQLCLVDALCFETTSLVDAVCCPTLPRYGLAATPEIDAAFYFDLVVRSLRDILSTVIDRVLYETEYSTILSTVLYEEYSGLSTVLY